jgi:hypothetical protein
MVLLVDLLHEKSLEMVKKSNKFVFFSAPILNIKFINYSNYQKLFAVCLSFYVLKFIPNSKNNLVNIHEKKYLGQRKLKVNILIDRNEKFNKT